MERSLEVVTTSHYRCGVNERQRGKIMARRREGEEAAVTEGLLCARAHVQVALNFELLHEDMNCGGVTSPSAD